MSGYLGKTAMKDLKARKPEALSEIVKEHGGVLLRAALGMGMPETDAEEVVQDTFATFLGALDRFEGRSSVRTFLFGILYRKGLERGRKRSRELATDPIDEVFDKSFNFVDHWRRSPKGPEDEAQAKETSAIIAECMKGLGDVQRSAFHLKEVSGESAASICNILKVTDTHLRVILFRARNKLRECIEGKWGNTR